MYIKRLLLLVLLVSCSVDEPIEECECIKTVTKEEAYVYMSGGLPHTGVKSSLMYEEAVPCQDELSGSMGGDLFFKIECN